MGVALLNPGDPHGCRQTRAPRDNRASATEGPLRNTSSRSNCASQQTPAGLGGSQQVPVSPAGSNASQQVPAGSSEPSKPQRVRVVWERASQPRRAPRTKRLAGLPRLSAPHNTQPPPALLNEMMRRYTTGWASLNGDSIDAVALVECVLSESTVRRSAAIEMWDQFINERIYGYIGSRAEV